MSHYSLRYLNRDDYLSSLEGIKNDKSYGFANMSLKWWDKRYGWYNKGCVTLLDKDEKELCYLFYSIDRYYQYLTIHNLFTPYLKQKKGYAKTLLEMVFNIAIKQNVKRFRLTSISSSLDFYIGLDFVYWGVNSVGDYYCDLPIPKNGLKGLKKMVELLSIAQLIGNSFDIIENKTKYYSKELSLQQTEIYKNDLIKLGKNYLQLNFKNHKEL